MSALKPETIYGRNFKFEQPTQHHVAAYFLDNGEWQHIDNYPTKASAMRQIKQNFVFIVGYIAYTPTNIKVSIAREARYKKLNTYDKDTLVQVAGQHSRLDMSHLKTEHKTDIISYILGNELPYGKKVR